MFFSAFTITPKEGVSRSMSFSIFPLKTFSMINCGEPSLVKPGKASQTKPSGFHGTLVVTEYRR